MPDLSSVPGEARWQAAAEYAACLAAVYEMVLRPVLGDRYDEAEQEIWMQMARFATGTARSFRLPLDTATDLAKSLRFITGIISGPGFKEEILELGSNGAVIIIRRCPSLSGACPASPPGDRIFHRCMASVLTTQKALNPGYSSRFVRAMCMGDRQCEIKITPEKEEQAEKTAP